MNKIKDVEKNSVYDEFYNKVDQIYTGYVHQIQRNRIFISDENKNELILPKAGQIPNDRYKMAEEVGDLFFSCVTLSRHLRLDAEMTLRDANIN